MSYDFVRHVLYDFVRHVSNMTLSESDILLLPFGTECPEIIPFGQNEALYVAYL